MKKNQKKSIAILAFGLIGLIGTYNALMINSESHLSAKDAKHFKRLDEMYGVVKAGRSLAVTTEWHKVEKQAVKEIAPVVAQTKTASAEVKATENEATINDVLNLQLVEVVNPKKWQQGVKAGEFNGSLATNNGIIESLNVALPEGMNVEISFSEMTGNVFEYDLNGEVYSGMMYQIDQNSYMVSMTNGPLEGTRLRFNGETVDSQNQVELAQSYLAENHNVEIGNFGDHAISSEMEVAVETTTSNVETASFNF